MKFQNKNLKSYAVALSISKPQEYTGSLSRAKDQLLLTECYRNCKLEFKKSEQSPNPTNPRSDNEE